MNNIKIVDLTKKHGSKEVLKGISVSFELGQIHGIIGSNGAGKSTFFECLCGLNSYDGKINCNFETPISKNIAYLSTTPFFYPKLTGIEYLTFIQKIAGADKNPKLNAFFDLPLDKYVENYSTGMKKKLSFLGLLLLDKPIYILDEPFNGVDLDGVELFGSFIKTLKAKGKTILISSHIINSLTSICDDIYHLENGVFLEKYLQADFEKMASSFSNSFDEKIAAYLD